MTPLYVALAALAGSVITVLVQTLSTGSGKLRDQLLAQVAALGARVAHLEAQVATLQHDLIASEERASAARIDVQEAKSVARVCPLARTQQCPVLALDVPAKEPTAAE